MMTPRQQEILYRYVMAHSGIGGQNVGVHFGTVSNDLYLYTSRGDRIVKPDGTVEYYETGETTPHMTMPYERVVGLTR